MAESSPVLFEPASAPNDSLTALIPGHATLRVSGWALTLRLVSQDKRQEYQYD